MELTLGSSGHLNVALLRRVGEPRRRDALVHRFAVEERCRARKQDVVEPKVPGCSEGLAESDESAECTGDGTANTVPLS